MGTTHKDTSTSDMRGTMGSSTSGGMHAAMQAGSAVSDPTYDLISVMYHTLQGCQTYERYAQDAERAGQQDLAQFFRDTGQQFERCAERGRQLLAQCIQQGHFGAGGRSGQQLSSHTGSSGQLAQGRTTGSYNQSGSSSGQQTQMGGSRGQQGSGYGSGGSNMGSSGPSSPGTGSSDLEGGTGRSGSRNSGSRGSSNR